VPIAAGQNLVLIHYLDAVIKKDFSNIQIRLNIVTTVADSVMLNGPKICNLPYGVSATALLLALGQHMKTYGHRNYQL
jgi:hypothetical protein